MNIEEMHFDFRQKSNKIATDQNKTWSELEIDNALNNATLELVEILYSGNNVKKYKIGFEVTQQRIDMLQPLLVKTSLLNDAGWDAGELRYTLVGGSISDYLHYVRARLAHPDCQGRWINVVIEQSGDMNAVLLDTHRRPSTLWSRFPAHILSDQLVIYTDFTTATSRSLEFEYVRFPLRVYYGGYPRRPQDNPPFPVAVDSDMAEMTHRIIVDIAVQEFARSLGYTDQLQLREHSIQNTIQ